jgi:hypothetical protein
MIYYSSGSDFGQVSVPVQVSAPVPNPTKIGVYKIMPFQCQKQHYFPERWPLIFDFLTLFISFCVDLEPNPAPEP